MNGRTRALLVLLGVVLGLLAGVLLDHDHEHHERERIHEARVRGRLGLVRPPRPPGVLPRVECVDARRSWER